MGRTASPLRAHLEELSAVFARAPSKRDAHRLAGGVLLDMAADRASLRAALAADLARPGALGRRHFPSIGLSIARTAHFHLVANCFFPLPGGRAGVTSNAVHHHGDLLLTTVTAFGPGYEHWRFTRPVLVDAERELFSMALVDRETHAPGRAAFVDAQMPHAVTFPPSLTVTFALWSGRRPTTWRDHVKRLPFTEPQRELLRRAAARAGVARALGVNAPAYLDFYPVDGGFRGMRERVQFQRGPNEDYLHTLFHVLQQTGNEDLAPDERAAIRLRADDPALVARLGRDLRRGAPVAPRFSEGLHWLDHMNFETRAIERSLDLPASPPPGAPRAREA